MVHRLDFDLGLHRLAAAAGGGGSGDRSRERKYRKAKRPISFEALSLSKLVSLTYWLAEYSNRPTRVNELLDVLYDETNSQKEVRCYKTRTKTKALIRLKRLSDR